MPPLSPWGCAERPARHFPVVAKIRPTLSSAKNSAGDVTPALTRTNPSIASRLPCTAASTDENVRGVAGRRARVRPRVSVAASSQVRAAAAGRARTGDRADGLFGVRGRLAGRCAPSGG